MRYSNEKMVEYEIVVKDLLKFYMYLRHMNITFETDFHTILEDAQETETYILKISGEVIGRVSSLYVSSQYFIFARMLGCNGDPREILDFSKEEKERVFAELMRIRWKSPIAPVKLELQPRFLPYVYEYVDDYPSCEAEGAVEVVKRSQ